MGNEVRDEQIDRTVKRSADLVRKLDDLIEVRRRRLQEADATINRVRELLNTVPEAPAPAGTATADGVPEAAQRPA